MQPVIRKKDLSMTMPVKLMINLVLIILVLCWSIPTIGLFLSSFRSGGEIATSGWWTIFAHLGTLSLQNYREVLGSAGLLRAFINSITIAVPATFFTILIAAAAAFPLASFKFPGKLCILVLFVSSQVIPLQITLIPVLKMLRDWGLAGTYPGIWIAHTAYGLPFAIYLLRNFFAGIPYSLLESATIDGAGKITIFTKILMPLGIPALVSLGIFQFLWLWNDLLIALVYLGGNPEVAPLTVRISSLMGSLESGWHIMTTAAFISMVVPMVLFLVMQKYFIKGMLAGSVKG